MIDLKYVGAIFFLNALLKEEGLCLNTLLELLIRDLFEGK